MAVAEVAGPDRAPRPGSHGPQWTGPSKHRASTPGRGVGPLLSRPDRPGVGDARSNSGKVPPAFGARPARCAGHADDGRPFPSRGSAGRAGSGDYGRGEALRRLLRTSRRQLRRVGSRVMATSEVQRAPRIATLPVEIRPG